MTKENQIKALKERRCKYQNEMRIETKKYMRQKHKSQRVRLALPSNYRMGLYRDKLDELNLIIDFLEGKVPVEKFIGFCIDDESAALAKFVGGI